MFLGKKEKCRQRAHFNKPPRLLGIGMAKRKSAKAKKAKTYSSKARRSLKNKKKPMKEAIKPIRKPFAKKNVKLAMMMIVPSAHYFERNAAVVRMMTDSGRPGVYISFHRPFGNIIKVLKYYGVNTDKLAFVDVATATAGEKRENHPRCIHVSKEASVDEIIRGVHKSLGKLKGKKFIFVDSLTTMTFYKPVKETLRLSKLLIEKLEKEHANYLILNVSEELAHQEFIKKIAKDVDEIIKLR